MLLILNKCLHCVCTIILILHFILLLVKLRETRVYETALWQCNTPAGFYTNDIQLYFLYDRYSFYFNVFWISIQGYFGWSQSFISKCWFVPMWCSRPDRRLFLEKLLLPIWRVECSFQPISGWHDELFHQNILQQQFSGHPVIFLSHHPSEPSFIWAEFEWLLISRNLYDTG